MYISHHLNGTLGRGTLGRSPQLPMLTATNETQSPGLENYGIEGRVLRLVYFHQIRAQNRPKSMPEFWWCRINFVSLQCQIRRQARTQNERHKAGYRPPDAVGRNESNTMKDAIKREQSDASHQLSRA